MTSAPPEPPSHAPAPQAPTQGQSPTAPTTPEAPAGGLTLVDVRRLWPDIVNEIRTRRRLAWMLLTQNAQVVAVDATTLTLGFDNPGARESFVKGGSDEVLRLTAIDVVGVDWKIEAVVDHGAVPTGSDAASHTVVRPAVPTDPPAAAPAATPAPQEHPPAAPPSAPEPPPYDGPEPDDDPYAEAPPPPEQAAASVPDTAQVRAPVGAGVVDRARGAIQQTRSGGEPPVADDNRALADAAVSPDDPVADPGGFDSAELLKRTLGARVIEEIEHE